MPEYIKAYTWEQWKGDKEFTVPSWKEFTGVKDQIASIRKDLENLVADAQLEGEIKLLNGKIEKNAKDFESMKQKLLAALLAGEWKKCFSEDIQKALADINQRYSEINAELDKKMSQLAQAGAIEEKMLKIFIEQEERFRTVIRESGKQLKSELDKKMESSDIIELLKVESQTITWEN